MRGQLHLALWIISALAAAMTLGLVQSGRTALLASPWSVEAAPSLPDPRQDLGDVAARIVASDPFRLDRKPAPLPFGSNPIDEAPRNASLAPRIAGIAGPPWRAALADVPGRAGELLVATGDTVGAWHVLAVRRDSVVIQTPDTIWRIAVRRP